MGLIGTIQNMIGDRVLHTERTTPESFELQKLLREMADAGCTHVVMEVSSHALMLDRVYGIPFAVGIYTNLSRDHLDFHKTMEAYCDAKALLMRQCDVGIYNADDPWAERLMADATCRRRFSYSVNGQADLMAKNVALEPGSVDFDAEADTEWCHVHVGIPALFTVYNTLDAMACCWNLGVPLAGVCRRTGEEPRREGPDGDHPYAGNGLHRAERLCPQAGRAGKGAAIRQGLRQGAGGGAVRLRRRPG